ncbi:glycosyltransferase family 2 protein [Pseudanabaena yagii]|uniref:Glycosyltransferase family 2 protein n=1 Tax=Pseudanabaena yagii GIHE-NHR1 TaxID=2722753 RepID=A0ABX1LT65_9CYAN|nr:glycosyltransferase family 2 protein [Pseudanabaena yagii]NMF58014.1 glycosyltransferase family 2 protein [Pseudanabaena yagii GIHE-NHR1]
MSYAPMTHSLSLSVVLPAYNEAENIGRVIANAVDYLSDRQIPYEIIVVNDGSTDATKAIVNQLCSQNARIRLINHPRNLGYGSALRSGFDQAVNEYIFLTDGDGQFAISDLDRFMPYIDNSQTSQIVIGYRAKRADVFVRSLNAWLYHLFIQWVLGLKVKDIDCAFKLFPRNIYQAVKPIKSDGALFSAEFLVKLQQLQNIAPIIELPVQHFPRKFGVATGANIKVILKMFWECWQLKQSCRDSAQIQLKPDQLSGINQMR